MSVNMGQACSDKPQSDAQEIISMLSKTLATARELNDLATDLNNALFGATPSTIENKEPSGEPEGVFAMARELINKINASHNDTANLLGTLRSRCMR